MRLYHSLIDASLLPFTSNAYTRYGYSLGSLIYISPVLMNAADTRQKLKGNYNLFIFSCLDHRRFSRSMTKKCSYACCFLESLHSTNSHNFCFWFSPYGKTSLGGRSSPTASRLLVRVWNSFESCNFLILSLIALLASNLPINVCDSIRSLCIYVV